jgi:L-amino acid N-acyltransferase YncA
MNAGRAAVDSRYEVRDARRDDLPGIVAIYNATIPGRMVTADLTPVTVADRLPWFESHQVSQRPIWVASVAGSNEIAAWLSFDPFYARAAYDGTAMLALYVAEGHRRTGLGRMLLHRALATAPAFGLHTLLGYIFGHNAPSLRLFEGNGFTRWGTFPRVAVLDGVERDLIVVGRRIAP